MNAKIILILLKTANGYDLATIIKEKIGRNTCVINECLNFLNNKLKSEINSSSVYNEENKRIWKDIFVRIFFKVLVICMHILIHNKTKNLNF